MNTDICKKAENVVKLLKERNLKIATAESCTGGLVSAYITSVSGASEVFEMGITSYSCRIKNEILNVKNDTLNSKGAVSEETVLQMSQNVKNISGADIGVAVSGVAGPSKSEGHPVGYVYIAVSYKNSTTAKLLNIEPLNREYVREKAISNLFDFVISIIEGK